MDGEVGQRPSGEFGGDFAPGEGRADTPMIALRGVRKSFGANHVLAGVDLEVAKGESMVIIGGSGTGKSVTLKCILGLLEPDDGEIWVDGARVDRQRRGEALLGRFGMLFQGGALFDSLPVWRNVAFRLLQQKDRSTAECREIAIDKLKRVDLDTDVADRFPAELSGGMQKRVGLARAIAAEPEVIFFDEPTTGLDPIKAGKINKLIRGLVTDLGATAITITHDMTSVREIADRVAMLDDGKMRWTGPVDRIDDSDDPYLDQFVSGSPVGPIKSLM